MIAPVIPPKDEPLDNVKLTIHIDRPTKEMPEGYIGMTAETRNPNEAHPRWQDCADGDHSQRTIIRVMQDVFSYYRNGHKSHVARLDKDEGHEGHSR